MNESNRPSRKLEERMLHNITSVQFLLSDHCVYLKKKKGQSHPWMSVISYRYMKLHFQGMCLRGSWNCRVVVIIHFLSYEKDTLYDKQSTTKDLNNFIYNRNITCLRLIKYTLEIFLLNFQQWNTWAAKLLIWSWYKDKWYRPHTCRQCAQCSDFDTRVHVI